MEKEKNGQPKPDEADELVVTAMRPVKLMTADNDGMAEMTVAFLRDQGIQVMQRPRESGGYMKVYMGFSIYGEDLFVDEADYDRAVELLKVLQSEDEVPEDEVPEDEAPENEAPGDEALEDETPEDEVPDDQDDGEIWGSTDDLDVLTAELNPGPFKDLRRCMQILAGIMIAMVVIILIFALSG